MSGNEGADKSVSYGEFRHLTRDVNDMKTLMTKMVEAINQISVLNERQQTAMVYMGKFNDRIERVEERQHEAEIERAVGAASSRRLDLLEIGFREIHIEREREKARMQTLVMLMRGLWAFSAAGGMTLIAIGYKLFAGS